MDNIMTIHLFNKLMGQETLFPLVCLASLSGDELQDDLCLPCDFYALIFGNNPFEETSLRLINPGEMFKIPSARHKRTMGYEGVLFHPDLLCDTPLEQNINTYPTRCRCHSALSEHEKQVIAKCLQEIGKELHHSIDRYSSTIIVSQIGLLLNYCTRFCSQTGKS